MKGAIEKGDLVEHRRSDGSYIKGPNGRGPMIGACNTEPLCRLVVKRARLAETWPTDIGDMSDEQRAAGRAFRVFAARVADQTMAFGHVPPVILCQSVSTHGRTMFRLGLRTEPEMMTPEWCADPYFMLGQAYRERRFGA